MILLLEEQNKLVEKLRQIINIRVNNELSNNFSIFEKNEIINGVIEYLIKLNEKGYITSLIAFDRILKALSNIHFREENASCIYGRQSGNYISLNSKFKQYSIKHTLFHELTHYICNDNIRKSNLDEEHHILKNTVNYDAKKTVSGFKTKQISSGTSVVNNLTFIEEIIAESVACDLMDYDKKEAIIPEDGIYTSWATFYNKSYQQLGCEFFRRVYGNFDGKALFKKITIYAMNNNCDIKNDIANAFKKFNPTDYKQDLKELTDLLEGLTHHHNLSVVKDYARNIMNKYKTFKVISRSDNSISGSHRIK